MVVRAPELTTVGVVGAVGTSVATGSLFVVTTVPSFLVVCFGVVAGAKVVVVVVVVVAIGSGVGVEGVGGESNTTAISFAASLVVVGAAVVNKDMRRNKVARSIPPSW